MKIIGIVDTTFARIDMGGAAIDELKTHGHRIQDRPHGPSRGSRTCRWRPRS